MWSTPAVWKQYNKRIAFLSPSKFLSNIYSILFDPNPALNKKYLFLTLGNLWTLSNREERVFDSRPHLRLVGGARPQVLGSSVWDGAGNQDRIDNEGNVDDRIQSPPSPNVFCSPWDARREGEAVETDSSRHGNDFPNRFRSLALPHSNM